ncbi:hypothetical protein G7Y79_00002g007650 [Physcia stellaris]|nr:hypothetical protein G7Y79_00002g007650 [Physcia stellaris]
MSHRHHLIPVGDFWDGPHLHYHDRALEAELEAQYYHSQYHHQQDLRRRESCRMRNNLKRGKERVRAEGKAEGFAEGKVVGIQEGRQQAINEQQIHNRAYEQGRQDEREEGMRLPPPRSRASSAAPHRRSSSQSRAGSRPPARRMSNGHHPDYMGGIPPQRDYVQQPSHRRRGPPVSNQAFFDRHNDQFDRPPSSHGGAPPSLHPRDQPWTGPPHWKGTVAPGSSITEERMSQLGEGSRSVYRGGDRRRYR